jgi:hypothetical protein
VNEDLAVIPAILVLRCLAVALARLLELAKDVVVLLTATPRTALCKR